MVKGKVFLYAKAFEGSPKETDFKLVEEDLPPLKDGEILAEAEFFSVDPSLRPFAMLPVGGPISTGTQVAKVIESKNPDYPVGKHILGFFGWNTHTVTDAKDEKDLFKRKPSILPNLGNLPRSLVLGVLGLSGNTAYFGLLEIVKPKPGETVVISGAAGAVGSIAGQIAKIKGAKVIGITGSNEKGEWLVKDLGFDNFINYKTDDISKKLKEFAPNGVDGYFDNVAGEISRAVMQNINSFGRIACCGIMSSNFTEAEPKSWFSEKAMLSKQLTAQGFWVSQWEDRWAEGTNQLLKWIQEGKLKYQETVTEGFENMPKAFIGVLRGGNTGKAIVKV